MEILFLYDNEPCGLLQCYQLLTSWYGRF